LAAVFADAERTTEWLSGVGLEHLDVNVEAHSGRLRLRGGARLATCRPAFEHEEIVAPEAGRAIMWEAYAAHCRETGRRPRRRHFDQLTTARTDDVRDRTDRP
jgi:hypothetical protein